MRLYKFVLIIFSALLLSVSQPWWFSFSPVFGKSAVVAQIVDIRKGEADRLLEQGIKQYQVSQFTAALQSWEQALKIYQEIQDRRGEGKVQGNLGAVFLGLEEILKLKLKADLVVLSACDTGRGRITGDGVIGLSRSLFIAGTPSVIVSLWAVPDAPTAELMTEFYKNLYKNKNRLDKAQALRMVMLKMKDKYSDSPRKWAAFTLIGESE
nr:CHAT domain-containing protein [Nostoc sp. CHAB 5836]